MDVTSTEFVEVATSVTVATPKTVCVTDAVCVTVEVGILRHEHAKEIRGFAYCTNCVGMLMSRSSNSFRAFTAGGGYRL